MASIKTLQPWAQPWAALLLREGARLGLAPYLSSTRRTRTDQAKYYRRYLRGQNRYPVAPPGSSLHEKGLAFDLGSDVGDKGLIALGKLWTSWGGRWGGSFRKPDIIHFDWGPKPKPQRPPP